MTWTNRLTLFTTLDYVALGLLIAAWLLIGWRVESTTSKTPSTARIMSGYRREWMRQFITRQPRIFDATVLDGLRQGITFYASTCLLVLGGARSGKSRYAQARAEATGLDRCFIATAQADKQAAAEKGFEFRPHSLDVNWIDVGPAEGRLAGYLGTYATYTGGAHPNVGFDVLNWDREAAREIAFTDLFDDADAARTAITSQLKGGLLEAKRERLSGMSVDDEELLSAWVNPAFEGDAAVFRGFTIARSSDETKAGGLIYHFAPYEVGAYAEGIYEVGVPYEAFSGMLKRHYRNAFGGTPILP